MKSNLSGIVVCCVLAACAVGVWSRDMSEIISNDPELSEFYSLVLESEMAKVMLRHTSTTVFAPTNDAFRRYRKNIGRTEDLLSYHLVKAAVTSESFPVSLPSEVRGGLPIWVSKSFNQFRTGQRYDYYANQGKIIKSDIKGQSINGELQILHVIDEVLNPTLSDKNDPNFINPSAYRIIANPIMYGISEQLSDFERQVNVHNKQMVLQGGEGHTFFIPVNGNNADGTWDRVDDKVIDGHIIPNKVFFTKSFPSDPQETLAFTDMLKVLLTFKNESNVQESKYELFVQSNTIIGYPSYPKGTVVANIVRANIPVKNGVVHLIESPLIIINKNAFELLRRNTQLRQFFDVVQRHGEDILNTLLQFEVTVFAPNNEAFSAIDPARLSMVLSDERKVRQMLNLHIVPQRVTTEGIVQGLTLAVPTRDPMRKLHFRHTMHNVTVVGGGINATILVPDIGATNGVIQVIDKVMGVPYHDVYEKLKADPSLSSTFKLGQQSNFNAQFHDLNKRFTYFVPHNEAWTKIQQQYPSESYKLFSGDFNYQVQKILNRHLIVNQAYSMMDLLSLGEIQMLEGKVSVFTSNERYYVKWEGEVSEILDPDVETANGRVHVVRDVLFKRRDLTTGAASPAPIGSLLAVLLSAFIVKFIV